MSRTVNHANNKGIKASDAATIDSLIATLASRDGFKRQEARRRLVAIGRPAVAPLMEVLSAPNERTRWEAAKALGEIGDPMAAPALVQALEDEQAGVRWLAAKGLIALGRDGLAPLLQALEERSNSIWLQEGAHHVLHTLVRNGVADEAVSVLEALEDIEPVLEVPVAAYNALKALRKAADRSGNG